MKHCHIIPAGDESLATIMGTAFVETHRGNGLVETEGPFVMGHGIGRRVLVFDGQLPQSLVAAIRHMSALAASRPFSSTHKGLVHQVLGLVVLPFLQQTLDLGQRL